MQFILPTGLSFLLFALAACGSQAQDEAAPPANQADEISQVTELENRNESDALEEQTLDPQPKELTDGEWVSVLPNNRFMKEHYLTLQNVESSNNQFTSFSGSPDEYIEKVKDVFDPFSVTATNPAECSSYFLVQGELAKEHLTALKWFGQDLYATNMSSSGSFMSYERVASRAYFSEDEDFPGRLYRLRSFVFSQGYASQMFMNFASNWKDCKNITALSENEPIKGYLSWNVIKTKNEYTAWVGEHFLLILEAGANIESYVYMVRQTGNAIESDQYITNKVNLPKLIKVSNKRAKKLAKAQGIEVEDIDIENLDKYKVTDSTVFPEYKKIENPNYS